jgi:uncharacterized protein (DUF1800 family)
MSNVRRALLGLAPGESGLQDPAPSADKLDDATIPAPDAIALLVGRTSFGPRQEEIDVARQLGYDSWLEYQLNDTAIDDTALESLLAAALPTLAMGNRQIVDLATSSGRQNQAVDELRTATILRQVYSPRQLYEVMVEFWTNHFNVQHLDGPIRYYKTVEDRELIRRHAMGRFGDLLRGNARSPAMLWYLDNYTNVASGPNENYARELLELHTMGATGGYTETDVREVARCFTGWTINGLGRATGEIEFVFNGATHDYDAKIVLGNAIAAGGGVTDGDRVLDLLLAHPSTARYLATKLVRRFVSDVPATPLVDAVAATYTQSGGDIHAMLRTLLQSTEFKASADLKFKRPVEFVMSTLRVLSPALSGDSYVRVIATQINTLGQLHFLWPTPDGYPDARDYWTNTSAMVNRWNFGAGLVEGTLDRGIVVDVAALVGSASTPYQLVDRLAERILRRPLAANDRSTLVAFVANRQLPHRPIAAGILLARARELAGLLLGSAYFQYR